MHITELTLTDYRSYAQALVKFKPGINVILGRNGMGKTNLMEALGYLATLESHRVNHDAMVIRQPLEKAIIRATVQRGKQKHLLELEINAHKANRARLNAGPTQKPKELLGMLHTILFAPEDLSIVKGDPAGRRRFIDDVLLIFSPKYAVVRKDYEKVLKQRNALLKNARQAHKQGQQIDQASFAIWNEYTAAAAAKLFLARIDLLQRLSPHVAEAYLALTDQRKDIRLHYQSSLEHWEAQLTEAAITRLYIERMELRYVAELERGISLVGPHRDDIELFIGDLPAKGFASQGESWSLALALKLGVYALLTKELYPEEPPVLILDDVFSELDQQRREKLAELVKDNEQVLITAAVAGDIPPDLVGHTIHVELGEVSYDD